MDKINAFFNQFGIDKYIHFVMSILIFIPVNFFYGPVWGVVAGTLLNLAKQVMDVKSGGNTWKEAGLDMAAGLAGSLAAWACTLRF
jgi:hypothetical protein